MNETEIQIRCTFDVSGRGAYRTSECGRPAVSAVKTGGTLGRYEGRCKQHASIDRRRTYSPLETLELTPEIQKIIVARIIEIREANQVRRAAQRDEQQRLHEAARLRAIEEDKVPWNVLRKNEETYDGTEGDPLWFVFTDPERYDWEARVKLVLRDGWPPSVDLRNASSMTINQASALVDALAQAIAEARKIGR